MKKTDITMDHNDFFTPDQVRAGRRAAIVGLLSDLCIDGNWMASLVGLLNFYNKIFYLRVLFAFVFLIWFFIILKQAGLKTSRGWFTLLASDRPTYWLWILSSIVVGVNLIH